MGRKIVVFGSYVADLTARAPSIPRQGETVLGTGFAIGPGGKGSNQAVAAHRAGADVTLITKVGNDAFGDAAKAFYEKEGMRTGCILSGSEPTGCALIMVDERTAQNAIVVVSGACGAITQEDVESCRSVVESADIVLLQLETNADALFRVIDIAAAAGAMIVLNPAPAGRIPREYMKKLDVVTPNETEAELITGLPMKTAGDAPAAAAKLMEMGAKAALITLGENGVYATDGARGEWIGRIEVKAVDTTGAGDAFNGAFAAALAEGMDLFAAAKYGNAAGALSVTKRGTAPAMPYKGEIDDLFYRFR
ncbi:MAG TPA: ribokinase [Clostridia bacterium]|nr:ribokinase [Clostridia bacterium]